MILRGWPVSPFTAKTRGYLRFRGEPFEEKEPSALGLYRTIQRKVGKMVMPTLELGDGVWLQDSSDIVDHFEALGPRITPEAPLMRFLSLLFEMFGDEWLVISAMQTRWRTPGNPEFAVAEFGRLGFPWFPSPIRLRLGRKLGERMQAHLPRMGLDAEMGAAMDTMLDRWMADLDAHLAQNPYLLGGRPCLGDYACMGPIQAHAWRDPASRHRVEAHPRVVDWMKRVHSGAPADGDWDTEPSATLDPLLAPIFEQTLPWAATVSGAINAWCKDNPGALRVPRALGRAAFQVGEVTGERKIVTYTQWQAQRPLELAEAPEVRAWLEAKGRRDAVDAVEIQHPMKRENYREWLVEPA